VSDVIGLYPGTFDPPTNGHFDIISRGAKLVDKLIVGVAINAGKGPMFGIDDRIGLVREWADGLENRTLADRIVVKKMDGLLVHYAEAQGATCIIRGLRAVTDFDYEFQMTGMNSRLNSDIETVFLMASERCQFISSRFVKEIGGLGGDISTFVPPHVKAALENRFAMGEKVLSGAASKAY
jgi:pantetheine-phosphate adenylyltransferase